MWDIVRILTGDVHLSILKNLVIQKTCPKRHQKDCTFFKSKKFCKHGSNCQFKHQTKKTDSKNGDESNEKQELKNKLKYLEETINNLKTENKKKDSEINHLHEEN